MSGNKKLEGGLLVGYSFSAGDTGVVTVGRQEKGKVEIVNAFQGKEAYDLLQKLITKEKK